MDELIGHLQGTCISLEEGCRDCEIDRESITPEEYLYLDQHIAECHCCNWWCEVSEMSDNLCGDCQIE